MRMAARAADLTLRKMFLQIVYRPGPYWTPPGGSPASRPSTYAGETRLQENPGNMTRVRLVSITSCAATVAVLLALLPSASAAPRKVAVDESDNSHRFEYDAEAGEFGDQTSGLVIDAQDPVSFTVFVGRNKSSDEAGEQLRAKVSLALNKKRAARYDGTFKLRIVDEDGALFYEDTLEEAIVLRPRKGHRRETLSFVFDLPTGTYEASARFDSSC